MKNAQGTSRKLTESLVEVGIDRGAPATRAGGGVEGVTVEETAGAIIKTVKGQDSSSEVRRWCKREQSGKSYRPELETKVEVLRPTTENHEIRQHLMRIVRIR